MPRRGKEVSKDKKKPDDKKSKKGKKKVSGSSLAKAPKKAAKSLQALTQNPLVADVVAAALISMAVALKDSDKAKKLASDAGDQLNAMSKAGAKQGNAMWDLALDIGRRTLESLAGEEAGRVKGGKGR
jgi:LAS superfamily LD-carboxypeptidase LdcB